LLLFGQAGKLHLVKPYMVPVQNNNVTAVNEALNEPYVEEARLKLYTTRKQAGKR
jgi:hypothetical protein